MNDDEAKVVEDMNRLAEFVGTYSQANPRYIREGVALIKRLLDENAAIKATVERLQSQNAAIRGKNAELWAEAERLRAEVERLTPKPMTLAEACDVLDERRHNGFRWSVDEHMEGFAIAAANTDDCTEWFREPEAIYIAQGLRRDAAAQEAIETKGGE